MTDFCYPEEGGIFPVILEDLMSSPDEEDANLLRDCEPCEESEPETCHNGS